MSNFPLPDGAVVKYAPAVKFHADERVFPCNIEYLMKGATLNYRLWRQREQIPNQQTGVPAVVAFQGYLYMLYTGAHDSQIWVTRSLDGTNWTDMQQIGQQTSVPAVAVFQGQLWMVYSGATNSQVGFYDVPVCFQPFCFFTWQTATKHSQKCAEDPFCSSGSLPLTTALLGNRRSRLQAR